MRKPSQSIPLARFRVYPASRKSLYFTVIVWRTLKDLRSANPGNSHTLGLCRCMDRIRVFGKRNKRADRLLPDLGEVHFCKYHLRVGIISHEFTHAAIGWAARTKAIPEFTRPSAGQFITHPRKSPEELFCLALGNMVKECINQLWKRKLIK